MIWLASFPRSGNTFFRNVLFEVYGLKSSTYHHETTYEIDEDYDQYPVVKTHLLPHQLVPNDPNIKSVYIVRDGRDALVSIANHRKDLVDSNSDVQINLIEAIVAPKGSHFGGWSENVKQWTEKADIIIRFEDLITDPIREIEKLRNIMELPPPQRDKLPTFNDLKFGTPEYGSAKKYTENKEEQRKHSSKSFRKGKIGGWKEEMSPEIEKLFWLSHGEVMLKMGYKRKGNTDSSIAITKKSSFNILIEANKIFMPGNDGVKRYQIELMDNIRTIQNLIPNRWQIDLYTNEIISLKKNDNNGKLRPISELIKEHHDKLSIKHNTAKPYEVKLLQFKANIKRLLPSYIYKPLSWIYKNLPLRPLLRFYRNTILQKENKKPKISFNEYDLIHIPLPQNFHFLNQVDTNFLVTVHDLTHKSYPQYHTKDNIRLSENGMQDIIKKKAKVLAISNATKNDLVEQYPRIKEDSISVIHEACDRNQFSSNYDELKIQNIRSKYGLPDCSYFLTLSTLEPRKNLLNTIKAFQLLVTETNDQELALFICGKKGWKIEELFAEENISNKNIFFTGFVDEEDLPTLYSNAISLCYVSLHEGFGLPPLEAMSCGTTVIYGDNSSMPEVIGNAGLASNPHDIYDIKSNMEILLNEDLRSTLKQKSIQRSYQFSWLKTAWKTLTLYEQCINENSA